MQSRAEQSKAKHSLSTGASREAPVDKRARRVNNARQSKAEQSKAKQSRTFIVHRCFACGQARPSPFIMQCNAKHTCFSLHDNGFHFRITSNYVCNVCWPLEIVSLDCLQHCLGSMRRYHTYFKTSRNGLSEALENKQTSSN